MPERPKPGSPRPHGLPRRPGAPSATPPSASAAERPPRDPDAPGTSADAAPPHPPQPTDGLSIDRYERLRESLEGRPGGEALPAPMLDGFLCGVLLQPRPVALSRWWPVVVDPDRAETGAPAGRGGSSPAVTEALDGMRRIAIGRHAALEASIAERQWFDPWVLDTAEGPGADAGAGAGADAVAPGDERESGSGPEGDAAVGDDDDVSAEGMPDAVREAVYPWVAGFAHAMASFQDLLELADPAAAEPQALICQFLDAEDLEDADALLDLIETLEPPAELGDAVEMLVRATLLLADITRPRAAAPGGPGTPRPGPGSGPRPRGAGGPPGAGRRGPPSRSGRR